MLVVMSLVLGLTFVACASQKPAETQPPAAPPEQPAQPPAPPAPPEQQAQPPAPPEQPAQPPAETKQLSFTAKTYTNSQYGFSFQYPDTWVDRPELLQKTIIAEFGVAGFVPGVGLSVRDADTPLTADWIVAADTDEGNTNVKVTSAITPTTLDDGTPAFQYTGAFTSGGYEVVSFATSFDKNGKRIREPYGL